MKITNIPILTLPNLLQPFKIGIDASDYPMGVVFMQGRRPICYHSKKFNGVVMNCPTYDNELFTLV